MNEPRKNEKKRPSFKRRLLITLLIVAVAAAAAAYPCYLAAKYAVERYLEVWADRLVSLEERGLLSKEFGAGWQDVLAGKTMSDDAARITGDSDSGARVAVVDGIVLKDYPSLSIIERLREIRAYSNSIEITDRRDRQIALIKTDHQRAPIDEFPKVLIEAVIAAEDGSFINNPGFSFDSFVRASLDAAFRSLRRGRLATPRGTSTITQQVAKLFISRLDETGRRHVGLSLDRKLRELRLAAALRKLYPPDDVLEVYLNHCVTSDYGMVGYKDIAAGLFNCELSELTDAQCIYLSRMVKWGRNARSKITAQCRIDMPRIGSALKWDENKQAEVLASIDTLTFSRPRRVSTNHGSLVDLANEFWLLTLRKNGFPEDELSRMNIINHNSLIRKKGNLKIRLTIDAALQNELERLVGNRGYAPDTTTVTRVRIAKSDTVLACSRQPEDTVLRPRVLREPIDFREHSSSAFKTLDPGDTVFETIRYTPAGKGRFRRVCEQYYDKEIPVDGQYFAYALMDSRSGKLLAYHSKDRIGSRLACLLRNRIPNGSSTAKPFLNAMMFDQGIFSPTSRWTDEVPVTENVPWRRELRHSRGKPIGMVFANSAVRGRGYTVHNHGNVFDGCRHVFDHLASSNNILGVETVYRLNRKLFSPQGDILPDAFPLVQYYYRLGALERIRDSLGLQSTTGVRAYKELVRLLGVPCDSLLQGRRMVPMSDSMYSVALGTLELSLYEQLHLFNVLYSNDLIERPAEHPSLFIESIVLNEDTVALCDTVRRYHPFADVANLRPTWLGLHKRLVSNGADGLAPFDIPLDPDSRDGFFSFIKGFDESAYLPLGEASNFAKSGTTDDILLPFDAPRGSRRRTNYGLWNAVVRLDLSAFSDSSSSEVMDVTAACIGECSTKHTGARDGKSLHKFLTIGLLKKAGVRWPDGFYGRYEEYLRKMTPKKENCGEKKTESNFWGLN